MLLPGSRQAGSCGHKQLSEIRRGRREAPREAVPRPQVAQDRRMSQDRRHRASGRHLATRSPGVPVPPGKRQIHVSSTVLGLQVVSHF